MKLYSVFVICLFTFAYAKAEKLEKRFAYYRIHESEGTTHNGGPIKEIKKFNDRDVTIFSPEIEKKTLDIKPRPQKITEALKHPSIFFYKDTERAVAGWNKFSKEFRDCVVSKKWPMKTDCLKKFDICFGIDSEIAGVCEWERHAEISECAFQHEGRLGLVKCLNSNEKIFEVFSKCFDEDVQLSVLFNVYDIDAKRRDYYTLDTFSLTAKTGSSCRFTVTDKNQYHLVSLVTGGTFSRPGLTMIPLATYIRDNYHELMENQVMTKAQEEKGKRK